MAEVKMKRKEGYIMIPYRLIRTCQTVLESLIAGTIWSFAAEGKTCNYGHQTFQKKLNVSKSTVSRKTKRIGDREDFTVQRNGGKVSTYSTTFELNDGAFIEFPNFLCEPYEWDGQTVELTPSEQLICAMVYTYTKQRKASEGYNSFVGSPATIAQRLNDVVSARTVQACLYRLEELGLVERKKKAVNAHGKGLGEYVAVMKKFRAIERAKKKAANRKKLEAEKAAEKGHKKDYEKRIDDLNAKSAREHYYSVRRNRAEVIAESFLNRAKEDARFNDISIELAKMEISLAKAEMYDVASLPALMARKAELQRERRRILATLGITEEQLIPQYTCKLCSDTGFLKDGTACDCYQRE